MSPQDAQNRETYRALMAERERNDRTSKSHRGAKRTRTEGLKVGQRGSAAVEYGIVVMLIAAAVVLSAAVLGNRTSGNLECTGGSIIARSDVC